MFDLIEGDPAGGQPLGINSTTRDSGSRRKPLALTIGAARNYPGASARSRFQRFIQYDTESQNVGTNTRLRWTIKPGNDVFIVWNRGWQRLVLSPQETSIVPQSDLVAIRLRWTFRR